MSSIYINGDSLLPEEEVLKITELVLGTELPHIFFQLSVTMVDDREMKRLNKLYRGLNEPTDVLSFVTAQMSASKITDLSPEEQAKYRSQVLCDIIIDTKQLQRQKGKNSLKAEFITVFIHGLLHLADYDHIRSSDAKKMKEKEEYYIELIQGKKLKWTTEKHL